MVALEEYATALNWLVARRAGFEQVAFRVFRQAIFYRQGPGELRIPAECLPDLVVEASIAVHPDQLWDWVQDRAEEHFGRGRK